MTAVKDRFRSAVGMAIILVLVSLGLVIALQGSFEDKRLNAQSDKEIFSLRTKNSRTYIKENGVRELRIFSEDDRHGESPSSRLVAPRLVEKAPFTGFSSPKRLRKKASWRSKGRR